MFLKLKINIHAKKVSALLEQQLRYSQQNTFIFTLCHYTALYINKHVQLFSLLCDSQQDC